MKHKTSELNGALLDAAVAKAEDFILVFENFERLDYSAVNEIDGRYYKPSSDWRDGGRIIERERLSLDGKPDSSNDGQWTCGASWGNTPLEAAMRAYVASKFGDEVELP